MIEPSGLTVHDFHDGMRVRRVRRELGPSFPRGGGYLPQPGQIVWTGTVMRVSVRNGLVWVQWDQLPLGKHRPQQPCDLVREEARALNLATGCT
jgi:hypothetical protein